MKSVLHEFKNATIGFGTVATEPIQYPFNCITLNTVAEGTGPNARIGRMLTNKSIMISGSLNNWDQNLGSKVKLVLLIDKSPNGETYTSSGGSSPNDSKSIAQRWAELKGLIYNNSGNIMDTEAAMTALRLDAHLERFKILKTLNVNLSQRQGASYFKKNFKIYTKLKSKTMYTGSLLYPIEKNELLLLVICDTATADKDSTTAGVQLDMQCQFKYTDA